MESNETKSKSKKITDFFTVKSKNIIVDKPEKLCPETMDALMNISLNGKAFDELTEEDLEKMIEK